MRDDSLAMLLSSHTFTAFGLGGAEQEVCCSCQRQQGDALGRAGREVDSIRMNVEEAIQALGALSSMSRLQERM